MFLPDTNFVAERHADLWRQADQQHLVRVAQTGKKSVRLDWRLLIQPMINWLHQQRVSEPVNAPCSEVVCC